MAEDDEDGAAEGAGGWCGFVGTGFTIGAGGAADELDADVGGAGSIGRIRVMGVEAVGAIEGTSGDADDHVLVGSVRLPRAPIFP